MQFCISILLFPFSILYGLATKVRNLLFDFGFLKTSSHNIYVVSVGNIRAGGTGKTPFVEYLLQNIPSCNAAVISRGYGRKTKGYRIITDEDTALSVGDEPLQMYRKFGKRIRFAVSENRNLAIQNLLVANPKLDLIILDDAFQHRYVKADKSILLTAYDKPFFADLVLPFGMLREYRSGYRRADVIVVTKCPSSVFQDIEVQKRFIARLKPHKHQQILFSQIKYGEPYLLTDPAKTLIIANKNLILLTAIADNRNIKTYLTNKTALLDVITFGDHHIFSDSDIEKIGKQVAKYNAANPIIITTEKDAARLPQNIAHLVGAEVYVLGIKFEMNEAFSIYKEPK